MKKYDWELIIKKILELTDNDTKDFNSITTYSLLRRYDSNLPFSFDTCIKRYKEELNVNFIEHKYINKDIFLNLEESKKLDVLNHILYYLHKRNINKYKLKEIENYLDSV